MNKVTFLCELPPPFGGVTVKNRLILDTIFENEDSFQIIDFCEIKRKPLKVFNIFIRMSIAFARKDAIIYGFGSHSRLKKALTIQKLFGGKKSLSKTVNVIMGGRFQDYVKVDSKLKNSLSSIKLNLVETEGMREAFKLLGVNNTEIFPNARVSNCSCEPVSHDGKLRCVFFSKICEDKGVDYILSEFEDIEGVSLDFYGHIEEGIKEKFEKFINEHNNSNYRGVFDTAKNNVYAKLSEYDVLLLQTRWKGEGVPGILVESKMAGITAIVSNVNYNSEIVRDGVEGIVLKNLEEGALYEAIRLLEDNKEKLMSLKEGAYKSKNRYALESYISIMRSDFGLDE